MLRQWTPWGKYFKYPQSVEEFVCHYSWNDLAKFSENKLNLPTQVSFSKCIYTHIQLIFPK